MLFHEKLDIKLIRLVKENLVLYDHNHAKYMDFNAREVAWQKIGDELKRSAADCKVRWINIRDVYRRILRKSLETGQRQKLYKYENEIAFLRPFYKDVSLQLEEFESDDRSNQGNDDCGDEGAAESDHSDEPERKPKISMSKSSAKKKRRKRFAEAVVDPMSTPAFAETTVPAEFDSSDPVDAFLLSIGATLKTFSPYHLNLAKSKIFSVVQEHDLQQIVQKDQHGEGTPHDVKISATEAIYMQ
ncbi:uncharacterized protein LOC120634650 [Pararge aegeria]|uniref:Jg16860 protein n=1 Tax=Pararge aegeria aegeria TaxID=348720 RepID=A0A8S4SLV5_9NEOP|nr:uncharacterized protein LOC120634650 [Pararge aegeria]CAH2268428.1 jg16860 [Pararge aegeria aegeria]